MPVALAEVARHLRRRLRADEPRLMTAWHALLTGHGECFVDRWPAPKVFLVVCGSNQALVADPEDLEADELHAILDGFLEAPDAAAPILRLVPGAIEWPRVKLVHREPATLARTAKVRRLKEADVRHLERLGPQSRWIWATWGGPAGLAASGMAYGAFVDRRLVSVACTFLVSPRFEDIGVVTEPEFRGRGLSPECVAALCGGIRRRRHVASWGTSPDNKASLRVAEKLGFTLHHTDRVWVFGRPVPQPALYP